MPFCPSSGEPINPLKAELLCVPPRTRGLLLPGLQGVSEAAAILLGTTGQCAVELRAWTLRSNEERIRRSPPWEGGRVARRGYGAGGLATGWGSLEGPSLTVLLCCSLANIPLTPETQRDQERRIRREIANSNERRRMQSINAGFQSLKTLIPHTDGEKLSKDEKAEDLRREMIELRQQLDKERSVRMMLEEQVRSLEAHLYPEKLKVIAQQVQLQQQEQLLPAHGPPAPTQHPTVIVPAPPPPSHHVTVVTMGPSSVINTISTSRQNLDTIVQAIQHIEGTQEKQLLEEEEQRRGAVIVTPARASLDPSNSDTASDLEAEDTDPMEHSKARMP
ncbi:Transcription factor AP-4, partial [Ophiophagus hannah]